MNSLQTRKTEKSGNASKRYLTCCSRAGKNTGSVILTLLDAKQMMSPMSSRKGVGAVVATRSDIVRIDGSVGGQDDHQAWLTIGRKSGVRVSLDCCLLTGLASRPTLHSSLSEQYRYSSYTTRL